MKGSTMDFETAKAALEKLGVEYRTAFDLWDEMDAEYKDRKKQEQELPSRERYRIRPVRITLEEGIVFTDTGEVYEGKNS